MTFFESLETKALTLCNGQGKPIAVTSTVKNNRGEDARISTQFADGVPAESETIPGRGSFRQGEIIAQNMLWGPETVDGTKRNRITTSIVADGAGGLSGVIDSSTNDPSGSAGQSHAMPLVFNAGEGKGMYIVLYPSDNTISIQDRATGISIDRIRLGELLVKLRRP